MKVSKTENRFKTGFQQPETGLKKKRFNIPTSNSKGRCREDKVKELGRYSQRIYFSQLLPITQSSTLLIDLIKSVGPLLRIHTDFFTSGNLSKRL